MGQVSGDMPPDLAGPDSNDDMPSVGAPAPTLVIQPVSGSGVVKSSKFKAQIQIGRIIDVTNK
jgi:hypothetical protein